MGHVDALGVAAVVGAVAARSLQAAPARSRSRPAAAAPAEGGPRAVRPGGQPRLASAAARAAPAAAGGRSPPLWAAPPSRAGPWPRSSAGMPASRSWSPPGVALPPVLTGHRRDAPRAGPLRHLLGVQRPPLRAALAPARRGRRRPGPGPRARPAGGLDRRVPRAGTASILISIRSSSPSCCSRAGMLAARRRLAAASATRWPAPAACSAGCCSSRPRSTPGTSSGCSPGRRCAGIAAWLALSGLDPALLSARVRGGAALCPGSTWRSGGRSESLLAPEGGSAGARMSPPVPPDPLLPRRAPTPAGSGRRTP